MLIAQISDLHIKAPGQLAYDRVDTAAALGRCIAEIQRLPQRPDIVLMTGDLTDRAMPAEFAHLAELLQPLRLPILALPGNHDERAALRAAFAGHWAPMAGDFLQFDFDLPDYPLRILGLDTTVPAKGAGELCAARLAWLEERLAAQPFRPTLIAMHHPPFRTGIAHMDFIGLTGSAAFAEIVARHPAVELIVCGHIHRLIGARVGGRSVLSCPSPAHAVHLDLDPQALGRFRLEPPGFLLHWWNGASLVTHLVPIGDFDGPHPFYSARQHLIG